MQTKIDRGSILLRDIVPWGRGGAEMCFDESRKAKGNNDVRSTEIEYQL